MNTNDARNPCSTRLLALAVAGWAASAAVHAADDPEGYVQNTTDTVVRNAFGECWRTSSWSPDLAIQECDPTKVAAAPEPAPPAEPRRTVRRINYESDAYFAFDDDQLRPEGKAKLDELVAEMRNAQEPRLQITGHTDRIGSEDYNLDLSDRRARAVEEYLVSQGIDTEIIETAAMGERDPVVNCEGRRGDELIRCLAPNRRTVVEFSAFEVVEEPAEEPQP